MQLKKGLLVYIGFTCINRGVPLLTAALINIGNCLMRFPSEALLVSSRSADHVTIIELITLSLLLVSSGHHMGCLEPSLLLSESYDLAR